MEEWKEYKISEIIEEIAMGPFGSNIKVDNFIEFGIPVLNGSNLQGFKLNEDSFNYVSEEKADSLGKANAFRGDVVITHRGTLGQIVYIPINSKHERYVISQSQFRLKLNQNIIRPDFFVYFFHTRIGQHLILMNASQVGVPALARPTSTFKEISIPIPPMEIQNKVMAILLSLDDKIELNNRINENLEQQAQALFKSWFVDFEPFKDGKFVDSELGMIPEGWKVGTLSDIANVTMGQSPKGTSYNENGEGIIFYQGRADFGSRYPSIRLFTTEPTRYAEPLSVLLSVRAPVGDINVAVEKCCIGRGLASIYSKTGHQSFVLYTIFSLKKELDKFNSEGTVFGSINKSSIENLKIIIPPMNIIQKFDSLVRSLDIKLFDLFKETEHLKEIRDTLLTKLMSGELKLSEIETKLNE